MQKNLSRHEQYLEVCTQLVGWGTNSLEFVFLSDMGSLVKLNHSCLKKFLTLKTVVRFWIQLQTQEISVATFKSTQKSCEI